MANGPTRVLVVEDDLDLREILKEFLSAEGHEVRTAANGAEALRVLDESPTAWVILLDMMLPVMDGRTLIGRLESRPEAHRVVMLSADESLPNELMTSRHQLLPKPFDLHALRAAIAADA